MRRYWPVALGLFLLALVVWFAVGLVRGGDQDRLQDDQLADGSTDGPATAAQRPEDRCATQATYDLMKRELFRQAASLRGSDGPVFDRLSAYAALRVEAPVMEQQDEGLGMVSCAARVALDLPPGVAVVGGRRTLAANVSYAVQPAADGSGDVLTLRGADAIAVPLATLARDGGQAATSPAPQQEPAVTSADSAASEPEPATPSSGPVQPVPAPPPPAAAPRTERAEASARPSFSCDRARTRTELAVCRSPNLAQLDREMASFYTRSYRAADPETRRLLEQTRNRFLGYRERCGSDACIADAYRGRITEIRDIMDGRWAGQR